MPFTSAPIPVKKNDNAEAKGEGLEDAVLLAARLAIQEVGDRERDHRENAGGEDGGESRAKGRQQENRLKPEAGCAGGGCGSWPMKLQRVRRAVGTKV